MIDIINSTMKNLSLNPRIYLQLSGTNVPASTEKTIEDEIFGGCFGLLIFFLISGAIIAYTAVQLFI